MHAQRPLKCPVYRMDDSAFRGPARGPDRRHQTRCLRYERRKTVGGAVQSGARLVGSAGLMRTSADNAMTSKQVTESKRRPKRHRLEPSSHIWSASLSAARAALDCACLVAGRCIRSLVGRAPLGPPPPRELQASVPGPLDVPVRRAAHPSLRAAERRPATGGGAARACFCDLPGSAGSLTL
jgi:hypothetical protein